ncbi:hypothetical protein [Halomicronema sp. CCY15110]|uniref:hypothetical protein n=1 Tax=Halomicronema sp. CCY15110 TaxID=2767773 RepID=UPI001950021A|nr:hypothetical protein [Halomicronema sp. CCY15110]
MVRKVPFWVGHDKDSQITAIAAVCPVLAGPAALNGRDKMVRLPSMNGGYRSMKIGNIYGYL